MDQRDADTSKLDGRTERRDRNRVAVLDGLLDLIEEGNPEPTVAEISERSQVSHRSVFRYFDDLAALFQHALARAIDRYRKVSEIRGFGEGVFEDRLAAIINQRLLMFGVMAPLITSARHRQRSLNTFVREFEDYDQFLRSQVEVQFRNELASLESAQRESTLTAADAVLSFECYEFIIRSAGSDEAARGVYRTAVRALMQMHR